MNPGKLDKRVEIWGKTPVENIAGEPEIDELGTQIYDDTMLAEVWAQVSPRTGSLLAGRSADTILSKVTHKIIIRYSAFPALSVANWIMYQGHRFNIDYVLNPDFRNEYLEIFVNEQVGNN